MHHGQVAVTLSGGDTVLAQLIGYDPTTNVALLRVDRSDVQPVPLEAAPVPVGVLAVAIGAEAGAPTAALGVVSRSEGPWRSLRGESTDSAGRSVTALAASSRPRVG
jgi:S1-C subfamily serine protease